MKAGEWAAIYDEFRDGQMPPSDFIELIDYNIHPLNVKGGSIKNTITHLVITSVQKPENLYWDFSKRDEEPRRQWLRRMHKIYLCDDTFSCWEKFKLILIKIFKYKIFNLIIEYKK